MRYRIKVLRRGQCLAVLLFGCMGLAGGLLAGERLPVPDAAEQANVVAVLQEIFGRDYQSRDPERQMAVANQLLMQGEDASNDSPTRYVALREAARQAAQAGEFAFALTALDLMQDSFRAETSALRMEVLTYAQRSAREEADVYLLAEGYLGVVAIALQEDEYEIARTALQRAGSAAVRARDRELVNHTRTLMPIVREAEQRYAAVAAAKVTLDKNPEDPDANQLVGRHEALGKGNWEAGLPHLAKAGTSPIAAVAQTDLGRPEATESLQALADAWYDLAQGEEDKQAKGALLQRAALYYERILGELGGLQQVMATRRIQEAEDAAASVPALDEMPAGRSLQITVVEARYGTEGRWVDVTEQAKSAFDPASGIGISASNGMAGRDPAPGVVKRLEVTFQWGRGTWVESAREGERLQLTVVDLRENAREAQRKR